MLAMLFNMSYNKSCNKYGTYAVYHSFNSYCDKGNGNIDKRFNQCKGGSVF